MCDLMNLTNISDGAKLWLSFDTQNTKRFSDPRWGFRQRPPL